MTSSWISQILYKSLPDGSRYLAIFCKDTDPHEHKTAWNTIALLYGGPESPIPPWMHGLISAGTGRRSPGLAYNRLLKGKYPYQRVEGEESVSELRRMLS